MEGQNEGKKPLGRPTAYTKAIADKIVRFVGLGLTKDSAAESAGISAATLYAWQNQYPDFLDRITRARAKLKPVLIKRVLDGSKDDPRLALEYASRLWPAEFGRKSTHVLEGNPEKPVDLNVRLQEERAEIARKVAGMSTDEIAAGIETLKRALEERREAE